MTDRNPERRLNELWKHLHNHEGEDFQSEIDAINVILQLLGDATSPLTTKGDLFGFDTADARIPVGTDGYVLKADSAEDVGVVWDALIPTPGFSIPPVVQSAAAFQSAATTVVPTFSSTPASDSVQLCFIASRSRAPTGVSSTNVTWTQLVTANGNSQYSTLYVGIPSGTPGTAVTVSFGSSGMQQANVAELPAGTPQFTSAGTPTSNTSSTGTVITNHHPTDAGDWVAMIQSSNAPFNGYMSGNVPFHPVSSSFSGTLRCAILQAPDGQVAFWGINSSNVDWHAMLVTIT